MSISSEILKDGVATAEAIKKIRNTFEVNNQEATPMLNPMAGLAPPLPIPTSKKSPRVQTNEGMLSAENDGLKSQLSEKDGEIKRLNQKLTDAYQVVSDFRESFSGCVEELSGKAYDVQSSVYDVLTGTESD